MLFSYLLLIIFFSLMLIKATDIVVVNLKKIAQKTQLGQFAITTFIIALATSLPELLVGIVSSLEGQPNLSLGNVIGSNIADLSLVVGGASLIGGTLVVRGDFLKRDFIFAFLAGVAPLFLLMDMSLSRVDGLILIMLYGYYNLSVLKDRGVKEEYTEDGIVRWILRKFIHRHAGREFGFLFLGLALLLFSADVLVKLAYNVAANFAIPILLIGMFIIAIGTSLPELVFEIKAVKAHQAEMFFGNLLGSIVANGTLIIGITAFITPIQIHAFSEYFMATIAYVVIFTLFYFFIKSKRKLERWEGLILILVYLLFLVLEVL